VGLKIIGLDNKLRKISIIIVPKSEEGGKFIKKLVAVSF
jgi:hypothetical protein